jgi:predicted alpha/beta-hydrolase family hydrolase
MLAADEQGVADGLLLLSYPLHPPGRPDRPRTEHLPRLRIPALFVHGTRDPFGSSEEMEAALKLIPAKTSLLRVEGVGHDLGFKGKQTLDELPAAIRQNLRKFFDLLPVAA